MADQMNNPRVQKLIECGDAEKAAKLYSMAYLLQSVGNAYREEADEILRKHGMMMFNIKRTANMLTKAFDQYNHVLNSMIPGADERKDLVEDYEIMEEFTRILMKQNVDVKRGDYYGATLFLPKKD